MWIRKATFEKLQKDLSDTNERLHTVITKFTREHADLTKRHDDLHIIRHRDSERKTELRLKAEKLYKEVETLTDKLAGKNIEIAAYREELDNASCEISQTKKAIISVNATNVGLDKELKEAVAQIERGKGADESRVLELRQAFNVIELRNTKIADLREETAKVRGILDKERKDHAAEVAEYREIIGTERKDHAQISDEFNSLKRESENLRESRRQVYSDIGDLKRAHQIELDSLTTQLTERSNNWLKTEKDLMIKTKQLDNRLELIFDATEKVVQYLEATPHEIEESVKAKNRKAVKKLPVKTMEQAVKKLGISLAKTGRVLTGSPKPEAKTDEK